MEAENLNMYDPLVVAIVIEQDQSDRHDVEDDTSEKTHKLNKELRMARMLDLIIVPQKPEQIATAEDDHYQHESPLLYLEGVG